MAVKIGTSGNNSIAGTNAVDTLFGRAGNDTLVGLLANDRLVGEGGNDRLDGGGGNDRMEGGTGNDTYIVDSSADLVIEAAGAGTDLVQSKVSHTLRVNVENLTLTGAANINGTGNASNNTINGNTGVNTLNGSTGNDKLAGGTGNDRLLGGTGNDSLDGGLGNDRMEGGTGNDSFAVNASGDLVVEAAGAGTDSVAASRSYTLPTNVENLILTGASNLNGTGNASVNTITGNAGINTLSGLGGNDRLLGGAGNDRLVGGAGNDNLNGGDGTDRAAFAGRFLDHSITVAGSTTTVRDLVGALDGNEGTDTIAAVERLQFQDLTVDQRGNFLLGAGSKVDLGTVAFKLAGEVAGDTAGNTVASAGDINGDGLSDFLVSAFGAVGETGADTFAGVVYVVLGTTNNAALNLADVAAGTGGFKVIGEAQGDLFAQSVGRLGDINGDGFDDFIMGTNGNDGGGNLAGAAYVVFGAAGASFPNVDLDDIAGGVGGFKLTGEDALDSVGTAVSAAGDINGDGFADILVGAFGDDDAGLNAGAAYVVFGEESGLASVDLSVIAGGTGGFKIVAENAGDNTAIGVSTAGDFNGDGFDDLLIGAQANDAGGNNAGAAYVLFGKASGFANVNLDDVAAGAIGWKIIGENASDYAGRTVAYAGDVNGDGLGDIVFGAHQNDTNLVDGIAGAGAAYVIFGRTTGFTALDLSAGALPASTGFKIVGEAAGDQAGGAVAGAGDVNGDGYDDLLIGSVSNDSGGDVAGATYLVFGKASGFGTINLASVAQGIGGFKIEGEAAGDGAAPVSAAGDVDGDGFDDLLIGASGNGDNGAAYIVHGRDFAGIVNVPGTAGDDSLDGTAGIDILVGGRGNDVLVGGASSDVMIGGAGNDTLVFDPLDRLRVDGGTGVDTLRFDGAGQGLDLTTLNATERFQLYTGIEAFDLSGTGANSLTLDLQSLLHLSGTSNALLVDGGADDTVATTDVGWGAGVADADIAGYTSYTNGSATLIVDSDIVRTGVQV